MRGTYAYRTGCVRLRREAHSIVVAVLIDHTSLVFVPGFALQVRALVLESAVQHFLEYPSAMHG